MRSLIDTRGPALLARATLLAALLVSGCGDDDDDNGAKDPIPGNDGLDASVPATPAGKCERLATTYCGRQYTCAVATKQWDEAMLQSTRATCERDFVLGAMCARAIDVLPSYDECVGLLAEAPCATILATDYTPKACENVIVLPFEDAGTAPIATLDGGT